MGTWDGDKEGNGLPVARQEQEKGGDEPLTEGGGDGIDQLNEESSDSEGDEDVLRDEDNARDSTGLAGLMFSCLGLRMRRAR